MICCFPSGVILATPPRASADHRVPSGSAKIHSGRCRSLPVYRIADFSTSKSRTGFSVKVSSRAQLRELCELSYSLFRLTIGTLVGIAQQQPDRLRDLAYLPGSDTVALLRETRHGRRNTNRPNNHIVIDANRGRHTAQIFGKFCFVGGVASLLYQGAIFAQLLDGGHGVLGVSAQLTRSDQGPQLSFIRIRQQSLAMSSAVERHQLTNLPRHRDHIAGCRVVDKQSIFPLAYGKMRG